MTFPANYKKNIKNNEDKDKNISNSSSSNNNDNNININSRSNNTHHDGSNDDDNSSNITIKRSTFTKLAIIGVVALMVSSFFAGYTLHQGITPTTFVTLPSSTPPPPTSPSIAVPPTTTANSTQPTAVAPTQQQQPMPPAAPTTISSVSLDNDPVRGNETAPITMVEFSDYQCPFCKRTFDDTMPDLEEKYIDTGKIKHVYRDYPLPFHQNGIPAAIAAECANEQGKFWDYHDILFTKQTEWESLSGNATNEKFKEYAANNNLTNIDTSKFNSCIDSQKYKDEVDKDIADGSTYGVSGTPTIYIGNEEKGYTQIVGAQPLASFESVINKLIPEDAAAAEASPSNSNTTTNNNSTDV